MYTGDDFNYAEMIAGDEHGYSHACSASSMPSRPAAAASWQHWPAAISRSSTPSWRRPCRCRATSSGRPPLLKTGVVFMAYLNGRQDHFTMVGGQESARSNLATSPSCFRWPTSRPVPRSRARRSAHEGGIGRPRVRIVAREARSQRRAVAAVGNTATVRKQAGLREIIERAHGTALPRILVARPGGRRRSRAGGRASEDAA